MNIYWPVYKNLESEFLKIMYYVHIDDNQLSVYSSKIADLILRAAVEIESICKELYTQNGGTKPVVKRFDDETLDDLLIPAWSLDKKIVIVSAHNCFQTRRELYPFQKTECKTFKQSVPTFSWNNAYQNLKHDRGKSLSFGSIKYLFDIMAALFVLNIYYKSETFKLGNDSHGNSLKPSLGSELLSINISISTSEMNPSYAKDNTQLHGVRQRGKDYEKSVYFICQTEESSQKSWEELNKFAKNAEELALKNPVVQKFLADHAPNIPNNWILEALPIDEVKKIFNTVSSQVKIHHENQEYQAIINKNQILS